MCLVVLLIMQIIIPFWWWVMVVPFVFGVLRARSGRDAFLLGVLSGGILWLIASTYLYLTSSHIVAGRVAIMMGLGSSPLLLVLTSLIAATSSGIAASTGFVVRRIIPGLNRGDG
jgi:hypothetical protein